MAWRTFYGTTMTDRQTDTQTKFTLRSLERGSLTLSPINEQNNIKTVFQNLILLQVEFPHKEVIIACAGQHRNNDLPVLHRLPVLAGPVGIAGLLVVLNHIAQHHNWLALKLPDHPPEVTQSRLKWCLSGYVGIPMFVSLQRVHYVHTQIKVLAIPSFSSTYCRWRWKNSSTYIHKAGIDVVGAIFSSLPEVNTVHIV